MGERDMVHRLLDAVSLRAHATAVGLVQLTVELRRAGVLDDAAVGRIKESMIEEICTTRPRTSIRSVYEADIRQRLDQVFAGEQHVGPTKAEAEG
ncbi:MULTISPECIES: hypothetical protein [Sphingomonas]|uniref:hypothetical protein n=1 Tax=Sphingomonas TaxID=13687 RepID=UPI000DEF477A|nr:MULTISPECIES: hypothetical protein [Sphingomonas]